MPDDQKPVVLSSDQSAPSAEEEDHPYGLRLHHAIAKYTYTIPFLSVFLRRALYRPHESRETYEYYCNQREYGFLEEIRSGKLIAYEAKDFPTCKVWERMSPEAFAGFTLSQNAFERDGWWPVTLVPNGPPLVRIRHANDAQPDIAKEPAPAVPMRPAETGKYKYDQNAIIKITKEYLIEQNCVLTRGAQAECIDRVLNYLNNKG